MLNEVANINTFLTSSSAIAERPSCRVRYFGQKWKMELEDNILRTL